MEWHIPKGQRKCGSQGKVLGNQRSRARNRSSELRINREKSGVFFPTAACHLCLAFICQSWSCVGKPPKFKRPVIGWTCWFEWENFIKSGHESLFNV